MTVARGGGGCGGSCGRARGDVGDRKGDGYSFVGQESRVKYPMHKQFAARRVGRANAIRQSRVIWRTSRGPQRLLV